MGIQGSNVFCNSNKIKNSKAKAIPIVKNGQIEKIIVTNPGNNYKNPPTISWASWEALDMAWEKHSKKWA